MLAAVGDSLQAGHEFVTVAGTHDGAVAPHPPRPYQLPGDLLGIARVPVQVVQDRASGAGDQLFVVGAQRDRDPPVG